MPHLGDEAAGEQGDGWSLGYSVNAAGDHGGCIKTPITSTPAWPPLPLHLTAPYLCSTLLRNYKQQNYVFWGHIPKNIYLGAFDLLVHMGIQLMLTVNLYIVFQNIPSGF